MDVLRIDHEDFDLRIESEKLASSFGKALAKQRNILAATAYTVSSGEIALITPDFNGLEVLGEGRSHPVFFENRDYFIGILFKPKNRITNAGVRSKRNDVEGKFSFRPEIYFLSGTISFGNDLGKSDLSVSYELDGRKKDFTFHFEVFPTKLDFRTDFDRIVTDIDDTYPNLVLDFLKKTYSSFETHSSPNTDLIWWQIFGGIYADFISASQFILNKPHNRMIRTSRYVLADQIKRWVPQLEEEYGRFRQIPQKRYQAQFETLTIDTPENRFFKYALQSTARRFKSVRAVIGTKYANEMSDGFKEELDGVENALDVISNNPFFRAVSRFRGIKQESLVLQKATGYRKIYKASIMLNSGLRFFDGLQNIELKNIADLYQTWCFLEMKNMLQRILDREHPDSIDLSELDATDLIVKLRHGSRSRVAFEMDGDLVELFHEFPFRTSSKVGVKSFTVNQEPDIVLRVTKNDLMDRYALTYLFDAKYRLQSDDDINAPDAPPDDAINQMHRYRDSIYFAADKDRRPQKEVIGAYVLFPGCGEIDQIESADYFRSIAAVNIGAFPLRPNDSEVRGLLEDHLSHTLGIDTQTTLSKVAPQKEMAYEATNPYVLIGFVRPTSYAACFSNTENPFYYAGPKNNPKHAGKMNLKYFAPYLNGVGITEYFEILDYNIAPRNSLFTHIPELTNSADSSERMIIRLGKQIKLPKPCRPNTPANPYLYTSLSHLRNPIDGVIKTIPSDQVL